MHEVGAGFKNNPRRFWSFVNDKRTSNGLPGKIVFNNKSPTTDSDKAELFAEFLSSVYDDHATTDSFAQLID